MSTSKPKKRSRLTRPGIVLSDEQIARIGQLEARLAQLESRIAELEKNSLGGRLGVSTPSPHTWPNPIYPQPSFEDPGCPVCGIKAKDGMFYVCNRGDCPSRITCCEAGDPPSQPNIGDHPIGIMVGGGGTHTVTCKT